MGILVEYIVGEVASPRLAAVGVLGVGFLLLPVAILGGDWLGGFVGSNIRELFDIRRGGDET